MLTVTAGRVGTLCPSCRVRQIGSYARRSQLRNSRSSLVTTCGCSVGIQWPVSSCS